MSKQAYPKLHTKKIIIITAIISNFLFGYVAYHSTFDGKPVTIIDWLFLMATANIMCIIPICLIILLYCKIKNRAIERAESKAQNTTQSKSSKVYFSNASVKQNKTVTTSKQSVKEATFIPKPLPLINSTAQESIPSNNAVKAVSENIDIQEPLPSSISKKEQISISLTPIVDVEPPVKFSTSVNSAHQELLKKYAIITPLDTTDFTDFDFFVEAGMLCIEHFSDSDKIKLLQRHLGIGFNRAIRLCDQLVYYKVLNSKGNHYDVIMDRDSFYALVTTFHGRMPEASTSKELNYMMNDHIPSSKRGQHFEEQCAELLKKNGFVNVALTPGSGDHGADILAEKDGISYAFQCKYYSNTVGNSAVQEAHSARTFYEKDIAVVITNSYFTFQAKEEAAKNHVKLWDKDKLRSLLKNSQSTDSSQ